MRLNTLAAACLLLLLGGCTQSQYACSESAQCVDSGVQGTCEPNGACSFPDPTCPSQWRYGEHSRGGVAGMCVPVEGSTGTQASTGGEMTGSAGSMPLPTDPDTTLSTTGSDDASADDTAGPCVPDCEKRECGADGCGGSCGPGCEAPNECGADGTCTTCEATWATLEGNGLHTVQLFDDQSVLVTGHLGSSGLVARLSRCDGEVLDSLPLSTTDSVLDVTAATATAGAWALAGNITSEGLDVRRGFRGVLDFDTLTADDLLLLPAELEEVETVFEVGNGTRWFGGSLYPDAVTPQPRYVYLEPRRSDSACSVSLLGDAERGAVRSGLEHEGTVYLGGTHDGRAFVAGYDPASCPLDSCDCDPTFFLPVYASVASGVWEMAFSNDILYAVGYRFVEEGADLEGFLVAIDLSVPQVGQEWLWNPTDDDDVLRDLWIEDDTIYMAALTEHGNPAYPSVGAIVAIPTDLSAGSTWVVSPPQLTGATDVVATETAIFVAGDNTEFEQGWVMRCSLDGVCPN